MSKHNRKPFEQHIESSEFNINPLIDAGTTVQHHVLHPRLEEWFDSLPQSITIGQWDNNLDDMQKRLRHSLATEIVERGVLDEFVQQLEDIDDETLTLLIQYPITLAMLSQDYFRQNGYPYGWESPDPSLDQNQPDTDRKKHSLQQFVSWLSEKLQCALSWFQNRLSP